MPKVSPVILALRSLTFLAGALCSLAAAETLSSQDQPCAPRSIYISVMDHGGLPIARVAGAKFSVRYRRKPISAPPAVAETLTPRIVILLDSSGSMRSTWGAATLAASELIQHAPLHSSLALIAFGEKLDIVAGLNADRLTVRQGLQKTAPKGPTPLRDAIRLAINVLETPQPGDAICLISDGGESASKISEGRLEQALMASHVRLFSLLIPGPIEMRVRTPEELSGPLAILGYVERYGGANSWLWPEEQQSPDGRTIQLGVQRAVQNVLAAMMLVYRVDITLPAGEKRSGDLKIEMLDGNAKPQKTVVLAYPHRIATCEDRTDP